MSRRTLILIALGVVTFVVAGALTAFTPVTITTSANGASRTAVNWPGVAVLLAGAAGLAAAWWAALRYLR